MNHSLEIDSTILAIKYSIPQDLMNKVINYRENNNNKYIERSKVISQCPKLRWIENEEKKEKIKIILKESDLIVDEWYIAENIIVVNTENFLTKINSGNKKAYKKIKLNNKESVVAEVIKEGGIVMCRDVALKYGLRPEVVRDWVQWYNNNGSNKKGAFHIREASEIFKKAFTELEKEIRIW